MTEAGEENIVLEGFLCPICKVDFGLDLKLFLHFQEAHSEDQDLVKSFKGCIPIPLTCAIIYMFGNSFFI